MTKSRMVVCIAAMATLFFYGIWQAIDSSLELLHGLDSGYLTLMVENHLHKRFRSDDPGAFQVMAVMKVIGIFITGILTPLVAVAASTRVIKSYKRKAYGGAPHARTLTP
ncbi:hypothetical protein [Pseudomonas sp. LRF_L74]|uniref:hypothetical protein n=1 Tax=Pseudomonas sp. LRF_L74 TaxID=3369422 RepID=UPI003F626B8E